MSDVKLGTVKVIEDGNPALMVRCSDGWLVAQQFGDPDYYNEISVYLKADDGRTLTLAIVGKDESDEDEEWSKSYIPAWEPMHVYAYNGVDEEYEHAQYVKVSDEESWWE